MRTWLTTLVVYSVAWAVELQTHGGFCCVNQLHWEAFWLSVPARSLLRSQVILSCLAHPCYKMWLFCHLLFVDSVVHWVLWHPLGTYFLLPGDVLPGDVSWRSLLSLSSPIPSCVWIAFGWFGIGASGISCPLISFFHDVAVDDSQVCSIVGLHWCGWLFVSHEL